jgi:hypothetical protein
MSAALNEEKLRCVKRYIVFGRGCKLGTCFPERNSMPAVFIKCNPSLEEPALSDTSKETDKKCGNVSQPS